MLQKTVGIVLHSLKYNDTSNIVDIYTQHTGRASFLVKIPRSRKSTVKSVLFQPLAMVEFEADYRPNTNLYPVKEAKSWYPFYTLPYDPYKSAIAMFLAEFLYRALREEAENRPLFDYLETHKKKIPSHLKSVPDQKLTMPYEPRTMMFVFEAIKRGFHPRDLGFACPETYAVFD